MRIAFIGASHWHLPLYLDPVRALPGVAIAGISDPDPSAAARIAAEIGCPGTVDYRALCEEAKPDFVIALGRHCDMYEQAKFLIEARIPFALEKPCGLDAAEVGELAELAAKAGVFAAVPLVIRNGPLIDLVRSRIGEEEVEYASFRFIAGPMSRYVDAGCPWMLDRAYAGGGCTINLAPHFFDLALLLLGSEARVVQATMANAAARQSVEDYSVVTVQAGARTCVIETGYLFPAPTSVFDMHYGIRTRSHYFVAWGPHSLEIRDRQGRSEMLQVSTTNVPHYGDFVVDALARSRNGRPPRASLADMVPIMRLIDDAYAHGLTLRELSGGSVRA